MKKSAARHTFHLKVLLTVCVVLSVLGHCLAGVLLERFGSYDFGKAVTAPPAVMVELKDLPVAPAAVSPPVPAVSKRHIPTRVAVAAPSPPSLPQRNSSPPPEATPLPAEQAEPPTTLPESSKQSSAPLSKERPEEFRLNPDSITSAQQERLAYQISLLGLPVGSAMLEATNKNGELRIITTVRSNSVMSVIYPVNDSTDTRLIKGRYLLTRIRQREGSLVSDSGFNLMFQERKTFWIDRLKMVSSTEPLEHLDTLDVISGFYFIRQQSLVVGTTFTLRLYDGDKSSLVPVEVLRREKVSLPGMRSAETLVIKPLFRENGFFKNNREVLIWLTDDENRVPVRVEVTTPVGRVVAELVSSERINPAVEKQVTLPVLSVDPS
ncbi:MAG: DUF3108 domain-containing protein [Desulfuromonadaceae bacterium]|nr:DUF3108 domain-containing protein [Desulfuromonadaceae bacterium]MDD2849986.1 DUF3108 domain-containing protein [Desulfuromonadaceae bacterium]MDD4129991.1 DUF3108 domain-containing protein [Desulfuromonadaceae bacterium]